MQSCLICDDHALVREALAGTVARRWPDARILQATDYREAWDLAVTQPELCLIDLDMPGAMPLAGISALQVAAPAMPIIVVTGTQDDAVMLALIDRGVAGFAPKTLTGAMVVAVIDLVLAGARYLPARLAELRVASAMSPPRASRAIKTLSERQIEVIRLMAQGRSNKDIARELCVAPATIKAHVAQIIAIVGAANRTEASMRAQSLGLL